jgi:putative oxidoreductase
MPQEQSRQRRNIMKSILKQPSRVKNIHTRNLSKIGPYAAIPLRLIVGYGFMAHGYAKVVHGPEHFVAILSALGVPAPQLMGWVTILVELVGGLAVLLGTFVPLVSVPMAAVLLVAAFTVHFPYGFSSIKLQAVTAAGAQFGQPGYEVNLLYLACLTALVIGGSGPLTLDKLLATNSVIRMDPVKAQPLRSAFSQRDSVPTDAKQDSDRQART